MNKTIFTGNVGRVEDLRYLQNGTAVLNFSVASNRRWKNANGEQQEATDWLRASLWGARAEALAPHIRVGIRVELTGRIEARAYTNNDGQPAASLEMRVDDFEFGGGSRQDSSENEPTQTEDVPF